jgi:CDGSH-type Zn-finger protein/uncharacterized Fe-S cluster protein YjdI
MAADENYRYPGQQIAVEWDERLCIHVGECGRAKGELFVGGRQPWCQPDLATIDEVIDVVRRCPAGALSYQTRNGDRAESADPENVVTVSYNGPFFVRGDVELEGAPDDMPGVRFRAALCRCGESKRKPFCDNSHEAAGFRDYGAVGETGTGLSERGGKLRIKPIADGPLLLSGHVTITASSGRVAWEGEHVALCRCGASGNKPFCDGSHKQAGFKTVSVSD